MPSSRLGVHVAPLHLLPRLHEAGLADRVAAEVGQLLRLNALRSGRRPWGRGCRSCPAVRPPPLRVGPAHTRPSPSDPLRRLLARVVCASRPRRRAARRSPQGHTGTG